jgi:hypothetical protein
MMFKFTIPFSSGASGNAIPLPYEHTRPALPLDLKCRLIGLRQYALRHPEHSAQWIGAITLLMEREEVSHG